MSVLNIKHRRVVWIAGGLAALIVALLTAAYWEYTQDDVYITYAYSRNIAQGIGFVFNPGEQVQGTTTPLYTLLMAGVYRVTTDMTHAGNVISALCLLVTCVLIYGLTRRKLSSAAQLSAIMVLICAPLVYVSFGMETLFYSATLLGAWWLWDRERRAWAMVVAAMLTCIRADGVVLGGTLILASLIPAQRLPALSGRAVRLGLIYGFTILPWYAFAWLYFGTPIPNTFAAKQEFLQGLKFWADGWQWWQAFFGNNPFTLLAVPLILIGLWRAMLQKGLRPVALWSILYTLGYTVLNVTAFWYYTPLVVALIVLAACGGDWLAKQISRRFGTGRTRLAVLTLVGIAAVFEVAQAWLYRLPPERVATYTLMGNWINRNTESDAAITVKDLGIIGYHAQRRTLDSFGLIVPDMYIRGTEAYAVLKYRTAYVTATQFFTYERLVKADWFKALYRPVAQFSTPNDYFSPMTVFRRRLALTTPAQSYQGLTLPLTCAVRLAKGSPLPTETRAALWSEDGQGQAGQALREVKQPFLWGQYPDRIAQSNEVFTEQIGLVLSVPPGRYRWQLDCDQASTGMVEVLPMPQMPNYQAIARASWSGFATLDGIGFPDGLQTWSGGSLTLNLNWRVRGPIPAETQLFVHLVDKDGRVAAQIDGVPNSGDGAWLADSTVIDRRQIDLPPTLPAGQYQIVLGWYHWRTGQRLMNEVSDSVRLSVPVENRFPGGSGLPSLGK